MSECRKVRLCRVREVYRSLFIEHKADRGHLRHENFLSYFLRCECEQQASQCRRSFLLIACIFQDRPEYEFVTLWHKPDWCHGSQLSRSGLFFLLSEVWLEMALAFSCWVCVAKCRSVPFTYSGFNCFTPILQALTWAVSAITGKCPVAFTEVTAVSICTSRIAMAIMVVNNAFINVCEGKTTWNVWQSIHRAE